jgi:sulfatase maturation enzyme AslB (radical SAM superfamily)
VLFSALEEKGVLITERNGNKVYENLRLRKPQLAQQPSVHILVVTLRCNANCIYCHAAARSANETAYDMTMETARKTVDFAFQSPSKNIGSCVN